MLRAISGARDTTSRWRLAVFAGGDFAFNLYWQSAMLYLLFYYTEAVHLPIQSAALCYALASAWDGAANLAVGLLAERYARPERFRLILIAGAVPLGLTFIFAYAPAPAVYGHGPALLAWVLCGHLVFRTFYAAINVPYLAMSARITTDSDERALVAGGRMIAGTLAAVLVAISTVPLGQWLVGGEGPSAYAASATCFSIIASLLLVLVGLTYRDSELPPVEVSTTMRDALRHSLRNTAFVTLCGALIAMIVAVTILEKSVLYYFKYALHNQTDGQLALGWMMGVSGLAVPLWMLLSRWTGARGSLFSAIGTCVVCLIAFIIMPIRSSSELQVLLVIVQTGIVGLHFSFWALLPDTVEWGQKASGVRSEALIYGLAGLMQRLAIGAGTIFVGLGLSEGQSLNQPLKEVASGATFRMVLAGIPLAFFLIAWLAMLANPLRKGRHDRIVRRLTHQE